MKQHTSKSISFLMELLIVIFFFSIAASICVLVMSTAKEKSRYADDVKIALGYGQRLIETNTSVLHKDTFAFDEQGNLSEQGDYQGTCKMKTKGSRGSVYTMTIQKNGTVLCVLEYYLEEASQ